MTSALILIGALVLGLGNELSGGLPGLSNEVGIARVSPQVDVEEPSGSLAPCWDDGTAVAPEPTDSAMVADRPPRARPRASAGEGWQRARGAPLRWGPAFDPEFSKVPPCLSSPEQ